MISFLLLAGLSGVVSYSLTGVVRTYALRHDVLDRPNERSSHSAPTPRGGGLAVLIALSLALLLSVSSRLVNPRDALTLGVGMLLLGLVGWRDDHEGLRPRLRLGIHAAVGIWTLYMLGGLPTLRVGEGSLVLGPVGFALGVVGIVWSINLFNFMDGIDGLAGSQAVLIFGASAGMLFWRGDRSLGAIALCVAAACAGFLAWNWPPAKIFMGDVGSGAIGYLAAGLAIAAEHNHSVPVVVFAIVGGVFIADATVTLLRRVARGDQPSAGHRDHAFQRLARVWGGHRPVTLAAGGVTLLLVSLGCAAARTPALLLPTLTAAYVFLGALLVATERRAPM